MDSTPFDRLKDALAPFVEERSGELVEVATQNLYEELTIVVCEYLESLRAVDKTSILLNVLINIARKLVARPREITPMNGLALNRLHRLQIKRLITILTIQDEYTESRCELWLDQMSMLYVMSK